METIKALLPTYKNINKMKVYYFDEVWNLAGYDKQMFEEAQQAKDTTMAYITREGAEYKWVDICDLKIY